MMVVVNRFSKVRDKFCYKLTVQQITVHVLRDGIHLQFFPRHPRISLFSALALYRSLQSSTTVTTHKPCDIQN